MTTIIGKLCIMFAFRAHLSVMLGHQVTFYAMIYFGEWRVTSLMPSLSCIERVGDGSERNALYDAFTAVSILLACIHQDAKRLIENLSPPLPDWPPPFTLYFQSSSSWLSISHRIPDSRFFLQRQNHCQVYAPVFVRSAYIFCRARVCTRAPGF